MISLMKGVLTSEYGYQDRLLFMSTLGLHNTLGSADNVKNPITAETIFQQVSAPRTRYEGLQLLYMALEQNADICNKGNWFEFCFRSLKDSKAPNLEKRLVCKILSILVMKDFSEVIQKEMIKDIFSFLLQKIDDNVEYTEEACICVKTCLENVPSLLSPYQNNLLNTILNKASESVSSSSFKVLAECFCLLPYCSKDNSEESVQNRWYELFCRTLKTATGLQNSLLGLSKSCDPCNFENSLTQFTFKEESNGRDLYPEFTKTFRRYLSMCKCLAKLLSVKCKYYVKVPVNQTLKIFFRLFSCCRNEKSSSQDQEILLSFLSHMRLAGLAVIESLMVNHKMKTPKLYKDFIRLSLECCDTQVSLDPVSELRAATWKLLSMFLQGVGHPLSEDVAEASDILQALLSDINNGLCECLQVNNEQKSKKITGIDLNHDSIAMKRNRRKICLAALDALVSLLSTSATDIPKEALQEICKTVYSICDKIYFSHRVVPFPYDDENCRELLYNTVIIITLILKPHDTANFYTGLRILENINLDPSFLVRKLYNKLSIIYKLILNPSRPVPLLQSGHKRKRPETPEQEMSNSTMWKTTSDFIQNEKINESIETSANANSIAEQSSQSEKEVDVHSEGVMEVETHYPELVVENQCNGEEIFEIQSSSQCQEDVESDEEEDDDDDEEEEEEEERSVCEEEVSQEEPVQETYIPTSRSEPTSPPPVQISSGTVHSITEPEFDELATCNKAEENDLSISNKDNFVNGESIVLHDENMPSSSTQVTNENGAFEVEEEDLDEENDEEEELMESQPADKKVESSPPAKKQKIEIESDPVSDERTENTQSPTLEEMKADFLQLLPPVEDVKSGKVQLSSS